MEHRPSDIVGKDPNKFVPRRFREIPADLIAQWPDITPGQDNDGAPPLFYRRGQVLTTTEHVAVVRRLVRELDVRGQTGKEQQRPTITRAERRRLPAGVEAVAVSGDPLALGRRMKTLARSRPDVPADLVVGPQYMLTFAPSPHVGPGSEPREAKRDEADAGPAVTYRHKIAVIDSGMWRKPDHPLHNVEIPTASDAERVDQNDPKGVADFSHTGHGGFIAGIITAQAPGVEIVAKNAFQGGLLLESTVHQKVAETGADAQIVMLNMSLGSYQDDETHSGPGAVDMVALTAAMREWKARGLLVVAAAGNDHRSDRWYPAGFAADPEFADHVVSVGALEYVAADDGGPAWRPAEFSNYGSWVTAWAPGVDVESEYPMGLTYKHAGGRTSRFRDGRAYWDGTSFATPHVAAAILRHAHRRKTSPVNAWKELRAGRAFVTFVPGLSEDRSAKSPVGHPKATTRMR